MELPRPYLFEIDTPLIVFNGRLIQPKERTLRENNYLQLYGIRYGLEEIITPRKLEDLFFIHNSEAVDEFKEHYTRNYLQSEYVSRENLDRRITDNKELSLIVDKILPIITQSSLNGRIEDILQQDRPQSENSQVTEIPASLQRQINHLKREMKRQVEEQYSDHTAQGETDQIESRVNELLRQTSGYSRDDSFPLLREDSVLYELLGRSNMMLLHDKIYSLDTIKDYISLFQDGISQQMFNRIQRFTAKQDPREITDILYENRDHIQHKYRSRINNKIKASHIKVNDKYYLPVLTGKTDELEERYKIILEKRMKLDAIDHSEMQSRDLYVLAEERQRLEQIANRSSYEENDAGFEKIDGRYYVYIKTPPYALKSPHLRSPDRYVPFRPAKIGVCIRYRDLGRGEGRFEFSKPKIMHSYRHPFLGSTNGMKEICLGRWDASRYTSGRPPEQQALTLLNQGRKTLMMGYRTGSNPYIPLNRGEWNDWITKEEVDRRGLVCLSEEER